MKHDKQQIPRVLMTIFTVLMLTISMVPTGYAVVANPGIGNPDQECRANGFDYGIAKWEWTGNSYSLDGNEKSGYTTSVTGTASVANWTSDPAVAGIVVFGGTDTNVFPGGTEGTVNNSNLWTPSQQNAGISHITFCGNEVEVEPQPVRPILECVEEIYLIPLDDDLMIKAQVSLEPLVYYRAHFGYKNDNDENVIIPIGNDNKFTGGGSSDQDRGQPTEFEPGRTDYYPNSEFYVDFDGTNLVWTLKGPDGSTRTSTASSNSKRCEVPEEPTPVEPLLLTAICTLPEQEGATFRVRNDKNDFDVDFTWEVYNAQEFGGPIVATHGPAFGAGDTFFNTSIVGTVKIYWQDENNETQSTVKAPNPELCYVPEEPMSCEEALDLGLLYGMITGEGTATVYNDHTHGFEVSLASYEMYSENVFDQQLYDYDTKIVPGEGSEEFSVDVPYCTYQIDLICGKPVERNPDYTEEEKLDSEIVLEGEFCQMEPHGEAVIEIKDGYPKGSHFVFECVVEGFTPDSYSWYFGNGEFNFNMPVFDVYYVYPEEGTYTVTCLAEGEGQHAIAVRDVEVVFGEEPLSCEEAVAFGYLTGMLTDEGKATVSNSHETQGWTVSLASYNMYSENVFDQTLYDYETKYASFGDTEFEISVPLCTYQIDLICGTPVQTNPDYTDEEKLDSEIVLEGEYCQMEPEGEAYIEIQEGFPQGTHYVFECIVEGFEPLSYNWYFGDGEFNWGLETNDVYYVYDAEGNYTVTCVAIGEDQQAVAVLDVEVVEEPVCIPEEFSLEIVSDEQTMVGEGYAELTYVHAAWTADIPGASWIWATELVENPMETETYNFTRTFDVNGVVSLATLDIATDNTYRVYLNGEFVGEDLNENNFQLATQDQHDVTSFMVMGENTLVVEVTNIGVQGSTPQGNPAGLLYKLTIDGMTVCDEVIEPYTVWNIVQDSEVHTILEIAVLAAGLDGALDNPLASLTVFAPTDNAFNALPEGTIPALLADPEGLLTDILLYHVVGSEALSTDLADGMMITTLNGEDVLVTINVTGVFINDAQVIIPDLVADNGVVHVIDVVLVPEVEEEPMVNLYVKEGFPQGSSYVFVCENNFGAETFDWDFGNGQVLYDIENDNVWHTYISNGQYVVSCGATHGDVTVYDSILVEVTGLPAAWIVMEHEGQALFSFSCENDFEADTFDWYFGDGGYIQNAPQDVEYEFEKTGWRYASCYASNSENSKSAYATTSVLIEELGSPVVEEPVQELPVEEEQLLLSSEREIDFQGQWIWFGPELEELAGSNESNENEESFGIVEELVEEQAVVEEDEESQMNISPLTGRAIQNAGLGGFLAFLMIMVIGLVGVQVLRRAAVSN